MNTQMAISDSLRGYLALPDSGAGAGILMLHAWWGLNDFFKQTCDRLAGEGFVVLGPDLYHGAVARTIEEAKRLRQSLDSNVAGAEVTAALDLLKAHKALISSRVGMIGFSLGCSFALSAARSQPKFVKAVVLFYGTGGGKLDKTDAAFLGHFAENDEWGAGVQKVNALKERIQSANRPVEFYFYEKTKHWFFEEDRPEYDKKAARLAWERTIQFLHAQLK